ncbi:MAG: response regulator [Candidatus Omnitrophica bacterium]|jgi:two-component system response regulator (stage 0 sporulation protein F)|nr:response regulator [Candidatus Omnitrophota bacterium]MDD5661057.1 response regulator [Candidatus Omnitrophota bacterium]
MLYKILIVDDEAPVRDLFEDLLKEEDCHTVACASGEEALELIKKDNFDVVLLDIKLPGMSGLEALKHIRDLNNSLPVVMITGFGYDDDLIARSKQFSCSGYIGKNMPVAQIIVTLKQFIKNAKEKGCAQ